MGALGRIETRAGIAAMNSTDIMIVRSPFMLLFLGRSLAALILAGIASFQWQQPGSTAIFAGGVIYVVGMFVCTTVRRVRRQRLDMAVICSTATGIFLQLHAKQNQPWPPV
jgi:uncharacterized membrane protein